MLECPIPGPQVASVVCHLVSLLGAPVYGVYSVVYVVPFGFPAREREGSEIIISTRRFFYLLNFKSTLPFMSILPIVYSFER